MIWRYVAVNALAQEIAGLQWGGRREVFNRLKDQGLLIVSLDADILYSLRALVSGGKLPEEKLSFFLRDFANMLSAGLAVNHILTTFKEAGFDPRAPYVKEHAFATDIEKQLAKELGATWDTYDTEVKALFARLEGSND